MCAQHMRSLTAYRGVHPAGEGSNEASSGGSGGDALGLGYDSDGDDPDEVSPSAAVQQHDGDTRKQEEQHDPSPAVEQDGSVPGNQEDAAEETEAASLEEEALAAKTAGPVAAEAAAEAAVVKDEPDIPTVSDAQPAMPSTEPAEVHGAVASTEDMAMDEPAKDRDTPALAEVCGDPCATFRAGRPGRAWFKPWNRQL